MNTGSQGRGTFEHDGLVQRGADVELEVDTQLVEVLLVDRDRLLLELEPLELQALEQPLPDLLAGVAFLRR